MTKSGETDCVRASVFEVLKERERERERECVCVSMKFYIERWRKGDRLRER